MELRRSERGLFPKLRNHHVATNLLPVAVDTASFSELSKALTSLLPDKSNPTWWPVDVPWWCDASSVPPGMRKEAWTGTLRRLVTAGYTYHRKQHLLDRPDIYENRTIYKPKLGGPVPMVAALPESTASLTYQSSESLVPDTAPAMREIFVCYFCENEFASRAEVTKHQHACKRQSELKQQTNHEASSSYRHLTRNKMAEALNLVPKSHIEFMKRKSSSVVNLKLDLDKDEEPINAKTPRTPRTPKSLIWQRDLSPPAQSPASSRRLCGTITAAVDNSDNDEEEPEDEKEEKKAPRKRHKLLNIDLSSSLGIRVANCVCVDAKLREVLKNNASLNRQYLDKDEDMSMHYDDFCCTRSKNHSHEKQLRNRPTTSIHPHFPIVFKPRRKSHLKHVHIMHFTRAERREFCKTFDAGLNRRARDLFRETIDCKIMIKKLTPEEIEKHTRPDLCMVAVHNLLHGAVNSQHLSGSWNDRRLSSRHLLPAMISDYSLPPDLLSYSRAQHAEMIQKMNAVPPRQHSLPTGLFNHQPRNEIICISDDDDDIQITGAFIPKNLSPKPQLKPPGRIEKVLFRCHLCSIELAFGNDESYIISDHFEQKHGVFNIALVQGISKDGRQLISIVEKAALNHRPKRPLLPHQRPGPKCKKIVPPLEEVIVLD